MALSVAIQSCLFFALCLELPSNARGEHHITILVPAQDKSYKWGFMDLTGKERIRAQFAGAGCFVDGRALVEDSTGKCGFIDSTGKLVVPFLYDSAAKFSDGRAEVKLKDKWGYIDVNGRIVIPIKYDGTKAFEGGIAEVGMLKLSGRLVEQIVPDATNRSWVTIDRQGRKLGDPQFGSDPSYRGVRLLPIQKGSLFGYVNFEGKMVIKPQFEIAERFSEGWAAVSIGGKTGYIDASGAFKIPPKYALGRPFVRGFARVCELTEGATENWGLINQQGEIVLPCRYQSLGEVSKGQCLAGFRESGGAIGIVNLQGEILVPPKFDHATIYQDGVVDATVDRERFLVDLSTRTIIPWKIQAD